jgi:hypothetical protein
MRRFVHACRLRAAYFALLFLAVASHQAVAVPRDYAIFPLGMRSAGMGETGTADHVELANTAYNPALVSMMNGAQAVWGTADVSFSSIRVRLDGGIIGGGYQWSASPSLSVSGGALFSYAKERLGSKYGEGGEPLDETRWGPFHEGYIFGAGAAVAYREVVRMGVGINIKRFKYDNTETQLIKGVLYDAGIDVGVRILERNSYKLTAAGGFAYLNFGGPLDQESTIFPEDKVSPPEYRRYGLNAVFDTPSWSRADRLFDTVLPAVSVSVNYDIVDRAYVDTGVKNEYMVGGELALLKLLFLRIGHLQQDNSDNYRQDIDDDTFGVGIAVPYKRYYLRFDYAHRKLGEYDTHQNSYGLVLDAAL